MKNKEMQDTYAEVMFWSPAQDFMRLAGITDQNKLKYNNV